MAAECSLWVLLNRVIHSQVVFRLRPGRTRLLTSS